MQSLSLGCSARRGILVVSSNEFWLNLHRLAGALDAEGLTSQERTANVVEQFREMPRVVQRELLEDLVRLVVYLPDVYPQVRTAVSEGQEVSTPGTRVPSEPPAKSA
jgi:hypothetical protein